MGLEFDLFNVCVQYTRGTVIFCIYFSLYCCVVDLYELSECEVEYDEDPLITSDDISQENFVEQGDEYESASKFRQLCGSGGNQVVKSPACETGVPR